MKRAFALSSLGYGAGRAIRNLLLALLFGSSTAIAEQVTIAALGDSLTAGYGLTPETGFVPVLQRWLDGQGAEVVIVNAGVSGDTTAGGLARLDWTLTPEIDGLIVALGANDYLRGLDPSVARANLTGILQGARDRGVEAMLIGINVGSNYGPEYKAQFDAIYTELAAEFDVPLYPSWFAGIMAVSGMQEGMTEFLQSDGLHPNAEGVRIIVDAVGPAILDFAQTVD